MEAGKASEAHYATNDTEATNAPYYLQVTFIADRCALNNALALQSIMNTVALLSPINQGVTPLIEGFDSNGLSAFKDLEISRLQKEISRLQGIIDQQQSAHKQNDEQQKRGEEAHGKATASTSNEVQKKRPRGRPRKETSEAPRAAAAADDSAQKTPGSAAGASASAQKTSGSAAGASASAQKTSCSAAGASASAQETPPPVKKPRGRPPSGKRWNSISGQYESIAESPAAEVDEPDADAESGTPASAEFTPSASQTAAADATESLEDTIISLVNNVIYHGRNGNLWGVLGLSQYASMDDARKACNKIRKSIHPDRPASQEIMNRRNMQRDFAEASSLVTEAIEILADQDKRAAYINANDDLEVYKLQVAQKEMEDTLERQRQADAEALR